MSIKKSSDTKKMEDNPGHRPINNKKLEFEDKVLKCPSWINRETKKKFKDLESKLRKHGLILDIDIDILTEYCHYFIRWRKIESLLDEQLEENIENIMQVGQRGKTENPLIRISDRYFFKLKCLSKDLGLSLANRYKVGIEVKIKDTREKSDFQKTLSGI